MKSNRIHFRQIDSTNTWAKLHAHEFEKAALTLITADGQTAGRGRFNRLWVSPPGQNIYATFAFFLDAFRSDIPNIPQVLSISASKVLERMSFGARLKWPNDVLLSGKKVAGILCETTTVDTAWCVVLGIGMNINMPKEILEGIDRPATSLLVEDNIQRDVEQVVSSLYQQFSQDLDLFLKQGFLSFLSDYRHYMAHSMHEDIVFHDNQQIVHGKFMGINDDGSLNLMLEGGKLKKFYAGEIL